jgi:hypothetical protein
VAVIVRAAEIAVAIVAAAGVRVAAEDVGAGAVDVPAVVADGTADTVAAADGTRAFATDHHGFTRIQTNTGRTNVAALLSFCRKKRGIHTSVVIGGLFCGPHCDRCHDQGHSEGHGNNKVEMNMR